MSDELRRLAFNSSLITLHSSLIRAIVRVLHVDAEVFGLGPRDYALERFAVGARNAHNVALYGGLRLELRVLDDLDDLFGLVRGDALLYGDVLAERAARRRLDPTVAQSLQRDGAADEFLLKDVVHVSQLRLVLRGQYQLIAFEPHLGAAALEVEALPDLLHRLIEGVLDFRDVHLRNDVE